MQNDDKKLADFFSSVYVNKGYKCIAEEVSRSTRCNKSKVAKTYFYKLSGMMSTVIKLPLNWQKRQSANSVLKEEIKRKNTVCGKYDLSFAWYWKVTVYISEMTYYVHYLQFSDYHPHLCHHFCHNVPAVVCTGLLQVVGMSNLTLHLAHRDKPEPCLIIFSY